MSLTPKGGRQILRLKIGDLPRYPFVNEEFTIAVHLVDDSGQLKCGDEIPLNLKLCFHEKPLRDCPDNLLVINDGQDISNLTISKTGSIHVKLKLTELSMRYENKKLVLVASTENINGLYINSAISEPMLCIRYRLIMKTGQFPNIWYKDEGGRDKCIEVGVSLRDHNNDLIVERKVPLKVALLYEDGSQVLKQEILKISPDSKLNIDDRGEAFLRLRIDDVSKNHQKQSFMIQISPDTNLHPLNNDISPDACPALEVRSKRNRAKRPREDVVPDAQGGSVSAAKVRPSSSSPNVATGASASAGGPSQYAATSHSHQLHISNLPGASPATQARQVLQHKAALENQRLTELMLQHGADMSRATQQVEQGHVHSEIGEAITGLVEWSQVMMDAIASLQWHLIGQERMEDGATARPLYEMANPNATIVELFNRYHDYAVPNLSFLYKYHFHTAGESSSNGNTTSNNNGNSGGLRNGTDPLAAKSSSQSLTTLDTTRVDTSDLDQVSGSNSSNGSGNGNNSENSTSTDIVPGYIPIPNSSRNLQTMSGVPLSSPLNLNFPSPAQTASGTYYQHQPNSFPISKTFSTDSRVSAMSAISLNMPSGLHHFDQQNSLASLGSNGNISGTGSHHPSRHYSNTSVHSNKSQNTHMPSHSYMHSQKIGYDSGNGNSNGMEGVTAAPQFTRQDSLSFPGDDGLLPTFARSSTTDFLSDLVPMFDFNTNSVGSISGIGNDPSSPYVFYILALRFHSPAISAPFGCPAFDVNKELVGFYVSRSEQANTYSQHQQLERTATIFCPLDEYPASMLTDMEVIRVNGIAAQMIASNIAGVYARSYYNDDHTFVEDAMIHWYANAKDINLGE